MSDNHANGELRSSDFVTAARPRTQGHAKLSARPKFRRDDSAMLWRHQALPLPELQKLLLPSGFE